MSSKFSEAPSATRLKREVWWFVVAVAGLVAGAAGLVQPPRADPFQVVTPWTSSDWWRHPIERNAFTRLAAVSGRLNHVFALPDGKNVWAVGDGGLIVHSADGGKTWEQQSDIQLSASVSTGATPGTSTPAPGAASPSPGLPAPMPPADERQPAPQKKSLLFDLVPSAHAAQPATAKDGTNTSTRTKSPAQQRAMPSDAANNPAQSQSPAQQQDYSDPPAGAAQSSRGTVPPASAKQGQTLKESATGSPPDANAAYEPAPVQPKISAPASLATINLNAIHFSDASHGWAVGDRGAILATDNGGKAWTAQTSGTQAAINSVHFSDASHGWAVGGEFGKPGAILATDNGGKTWTAQTSGTQAWLRSVHFSDASHGWAVGGRFGEQIGRAHV